MEGCARADALALLRFLCFFGYVSVSVLTSVHHVSPSALGSVRHFLYTETKAPQHKNDRRQVCA